MKHWIMILVGTGLACLIGLGTASSVAFAGVPLCAYVPETGHNIHGAFLAFYLAHHGVENLGVPLTEAFLENGFVVQYFTRARLEFHPENPEPYRVQLGLLGSEFGVFDPPKIWPRGPFVFDSTTKYFPATGQMISLGIKTYFDQHSGLDILGYPITGIHFENGKFVQYFQRTRLEWDPIDPNANAIAYPNPVGQIWLDKKYPNSLVARNRIVSDGCATPLAVPQTQAVPTALSATPLPATFKLNPSVRVRVQIPQTAMTGQQTVDVFVEDQNGKPIAGAAIYAVVHFTKGERWFPLLSTDAAGRTSFIFDIGVESPNTPTLIEARAFVGGESRVGIGSFIRYP